MFCLIILLLLNYVYTVIDVWARPITEQYLNENNNNRHLIIFVGDCSVEGGVTSCSVLGHGVGLSTIS